MAGDRAARDREGAETPLDGGIARDRGLEAGRGHPQRLSGRDTVGEREVGDPARPGEGAEVAGSTERDEAVSLLERKGIDATATDERAGRIAAGQDVGAAAPANHNPDTAGSLEQVAAIGADEIGRVIGELAAGEREENAHGSQIHRRCLDA